MDPQQPVFKYELVPRRADLGPGGAPLLPIPAVVHFGARALRCAASPKNNTALWLKYNNINGIWALKPYYLGPCVMWLQA